MNILSIINAVAATSSRLEKEAILKQHADNELLQAVFKAAYDPTINYFLKKIPAPKNALGDGPAPKISLTQAVQNLSVLSERNLTGNDAIEFLADLLFVLTEDDAEVISRIVQRDLKCGATDSTANKIWKGLIPEFPYMRCSLPKDVKLDKWDWERGIYSQVKADAMFANCDVIDSENIIFSSRNGTEFPSEKLAQLIAEVRESFPVGYRLNGELMVERDGLLLAREVSNGIMNKVVKGDYTFAENERAVYYVWDMIPLEYAVPGGKYDVDYINRFSQLNSCCGASEGGHVRLIETRVVRSLDEAYEHYFELIAKGLEGTIIKTKTGKWADSTSRDQVKLKVECDVDLEILGFTEGNGKNAALFGSVTCGTIDRKLIVNVSGFKDKEREEIHRTRAEKLGMIMTVRFNNIMKPSKEGEPWSLFLPRHIEIRTDKTEADTLQRVIDQFESLIKPKK